MHPANRSSSEELSRAPETLGRQEQNEWINARMWQIQLRWHDLFDADPGEYASQTPRPDPLPTHVDDDHRLMFGLRGIAPDTRRACYAMLPEGAEMCRRFDLFVTSPRIDLPQPDVRALTTQLAELVASVGPDARVRWDQVRFASASDAGIEHTMRTTGGVTELLDLRRPSHRGGDPASRAAYYFLADAHYHAAGNRYELHDWVCGAMLGRDLDQMFEILYRLWRSDWQVFCSEDGLLLVDLAA